VLDVGVTSDRGYDHSNYLEAFYPHKHRITAVGLDDAKFLEEMYPGLTFVQANGLDLPFPDGAFDIVHSSAVIEHVGSAANQARFLSELWRVARRGLFITTPNRWHPVEFHTVLPLLHWLPPGQYRRILRRMGRDFFAEEANLNLMSRATLDVAAREAGVPAPRHASVALMGWPTNLLLIAEKDPLARLPLKEASGVTARAAAE
jgi:hypothetical protein